MGGVHFSPKKHSNSGRIRNFVRSTAFTCAVLLSPLALFSPRKAMADEVNPPKVERQERRREGHQLEIGFTGSNVTGQ